MKLTKLFRYPLKSGAGQVLESARVDSEGLVGDRQYVLANAEGRFVTARELPQLGQIEFDKEQFVFHGQRSPELRFQQTASVSIWKRTQPSEVAVDEVNQWFSRLLGVPVRLHRRPADSEQHFGDSKPVLVVSQATLEAMGNYPALQFRPNLVIDHGEAFGEENLGALTFGEVRLAPVKPCGRCKMINLTPGAAAYPDGQPVSKRLLEHSPDFVLGHYFRVAAGGELRVQ